MVTYAYFMAIISMFVRLNVLTYTSMVVNRCYGEISYKISDIV